MRDSRLNEAEHPLQHSFRKALVFNSLLMASAVGAAHLALRSLPSVPTLPPSVADVTFKPVDLFPVGGPLHLAGAWEMTVADRRFGGISALALDGGRFLAVSDRGSVVSFDRPSIRMPKAWIADLRQGPGPWGRKWARDAESIAADPEGRGWWVGYEQNHSLWLYDSAFGHALASIDLHRPDWWDNRGAEGLMAENGALLVMAENGREAMRVESGRIERLSLAAGADVAEAATAPDGSSWLLLRNKGWGGISQSIAPIVKVGQGHRTESKLPLPKHAFDNYEGMAIEERPGGELRFWLISDDGHRLMARTLLVALDYRPKARND